MTRHGAIIKRLGGYVRIANLLGVPEQTVKSWAKVGRNIPAKHWHRLSALAPDLTPERLERSKDR